MTDISVTDNCKNPDSYGEICVKCNKCGRFGEQKMTRAEAIKILNGLFYPNGTDEETERENEALKMAISTLECGKMLEVCYDQVKQERDIAIEQLKELGYELGQKIEPSRKGHSELKALIDKHRMYRLTDDEMSEFERDVLNLVKENYQPSRKVIPKEKMTKEEVITDLYWLFGSNLLDKGSEDTVSNAIYYLNQPSRKGHWIDVSNFVYECSNCGGRGMFRELFCPNCGADMRGDTE